MGIGAVPVLISKRMKEQGIKTVSRRTAFKITICSIILVFALSFELKSFSKVELTLGQEEILNSLSKTYPRYATELLAVHQLADIYCQKPDIQCLSDDIEVEVTYMRIRETKPKVIWEISPSHGYSTLWIMEALKGNKNNGELYSFDIQSLVEDFAPEEWKENGWNFVLGDFKEKFSTFVDLYPTPDYLFLDSLHTEEFGRFYISELFPMLLKHKKKIFASLHDVYNPTFWTDGPRSQLRKEANLPEWLPNEEGQVVLDWIVYHPKCTNGIFTVAPSHDQDLFQNVSKLRALSMPTSNPNSSPNPTVYFNLLQSCI
ncbi:S-adenosyl-L-methionine-dependent methyltransferase [Gracilaria domingensis]|nr:S-adenosyl-L-methionine-dependent methyltransferase [Gracilaria domingensis]